MNTEEKRKEIEKMVVVRHEHTLNELATASDEVIEQIYENPLHFGLLDGSDEEDRPEENRLTNVFEPKSLAGKEYQSEIIQLYDAMLSARQLEKLVLDNCKSVDNKEFQTAVNYLYKAIEHGIGKATRDLVDAEEAKIDAMLRGETESPY